jgi:uncharacterized protein (UPF0371 family)
MDEFFTFIKLLAKRNKEEVIYEVWLHRVKDKSLGEYKEELEANEKLLNEVMQARIEAGFDPNEKITMTELERLRGLDIE